MKPRCSFLCCLVTFAATQAGSQNLYVRLVDGRSGRPVANTYVNLWVGDNRKDAVPVSLDSHGTGQFLLTDEQPGTPVDANSPHPTFPYAPTIRLQVGRVLCQDTRTNYSWLQITPYPTDAWAHTGIVTTNTCGKATAVPEPGVLTLFVRPLTFWQMLRE